MYAMSALVVFLFGLSGAPTPAARTIQSDKPAVAQTARNDADQISGHWAVTFKVEDMSVPAEFTFQLARDGQLTGTVYSEHTGPGTIHDGKWADGKLSCTMVFAAHESILVTGKLDGEKLTGEFATEGRKGAWEATREATKN